MLLFRSCLELLSNIFLLKTPDGMIKSLTVSYDVLSPRHLFSLLLQTGVHLPKKEVEVEREEVYVQF